MIVDGMKTCIFKNIGLYRSDFFPLHYELFPLVGQWHVIRLWVPMGHALALVLVHSGLSPDLVLFTAAVTTATLLTPCTKLQYLWGRGSWLRWHSAWLIWSPLWECVCWRRPGWWPHCATGYRSGGCRCFPSADLAHCPGQRRSGWICQWSHSNSTWISLYTL